MLISEQQLTEIFLALLKPLYKSQPMPEFNLCFYPYVGINSTMRRVKNCLIVRISDILQAAPLNVHQALAAILVAKFFKRKVSPQHRQTFQAYVAQPSIQAVSTQVHRQRGYKHLTTAQGTVYDLANLFQILNERFFNSQLSLPTLSWSRQATKRRMGHYDTTHHTIVISKSLDQPQVPEYVVQFILYHEMLHIKHPSRLSAERCSHHPPEFQKEEKLFPHYAEATKWLKLFATTKSSQQRTTKRTRRTKQA